VYEDASLAVQLDDMNPGIASTGLFWTMAVPEGSVDVDFEKGRAELRVEHAKIEDFGTFLNSLFGGPSQPTTASFEVHWAGKSPRQHVVNAAGEMEGQFIRNAATMEWSATNEKYTFVSHPASTSSSSFAEIGFERNGVFFRDR
jgi:hypothetical protein